MDVKTTYEDYLNLAREKYPSLNYSTNIFQSPNKISEHYNTYQKIRNDFGQHFNLQNEGMAEIEQSSKEDYLMKEKAVSFLTNNIKYFNEVNTDSSYYKDIDRSVGVLESLNHEQRQEYYKNRTSNLQKKSLSLLGVKDEKDFDNTLEMIKVGSSADSGVMTQVVTDEEGNKKEVDVTLEEILKGVGSTALAGAGVGSVVGGPVGTLIGGAIGGIIGGITEIADSLSENGIIEGVNNARRNFVSAMYGSTIGMVGDASGGIGNAINTLLTNVTDKDMEELQTYNPFSIVEGITDGIDNHLINKQKDEYSGFNNFLVQGLPSVMGSLAGFVVLGSAFGKMFSGSKPIKLKSGVLNKFFGGNPSELALRSSVALGAMDDTFDTLKSQGIENSKAFTSSLATGGLNWAVLSFTEAGIGKRVERSLQDKFGNLAITKMIKGIPMEMAKEGAEEVGEQLSSDIGQSLGLGKAEFASMKEYVNTAFLGAVGGLIGGGVGYFNHRKAVEQSWQDFKKIDTDKLMEGYKQEVKEEYERKNVTLSELELKDKTLKRMSDDGIDGVPMVALQHVYGHISEQMKISIEKTVKYFKEEVQPKAEKFLQSQTDLDVTEANINKVSFLIHEMNTNENLEVRKELEENLELYAKLEDVDTYNLVSNLKQYQKEELKSLSKRQLGKRVEEMAQEGYNEFYNEVKDVVGSQKEKVISLLNKWGLSKSEVDTMYSNELINQKVYNDFNQKYDKEVANVDYAFEKYMVNPTKQNKTAIFDILGTGKNVFQYLSEHKKSNINEYVRLLNDLDLSSYDKGYKRMISLGNDIQGVLDSGEETLLKHNTTINDNSKQKNAEMLQTIKTLKSELKSEYGRLSRVPFDMISEYTGEDITLEKLNDLEKRIKGEYKQASKQTKEEIEQKPIREIKVDGVLQAPSHKAYYEKYRSATEKLDNKVRQVYLENVASKVGNFNDLPAKIKDRYDIKDFRDITMQIVLDKMNNRKKAFEEIELNSKIKNELKDVITLYHGTNADFKKFDVKVIPDNTYNRKEGIGIYLTPNKEVAERYGKNIKTINMPLKNVKNFDNKEVIRGEIDNLRNRILEEFGYDIYTAPYFDVETEVERIFDGEHSIDFFRNVSLYVDADEKIWQQNEFEVESLEDFIEQYKDDFLSNNVVSYFDKDHNSIVVFSEKDNLINEYIEDNPIKFGDLSQAKPNYTVGRENPSTKYNNTNVDVEVLSKIQDVDRIGQYTAFNSELGKQQTLELAKDIAENGIQYPVVIDYNPETGNVVLGEGNHRLQVAQLLGLKNIPVRVVIGNGTNANYRNMSIGKNLVEGGYGASWDNGENVDVIVKRLSEMDRKTTPYEVNEFQELGRRNRKIVQEIKNKKEGLLEDIDKEISEYKEEIVNTKEKISKEQDRLNNRTQEEIDKDITSSMVDEELGFKKKTELDFLNERLSNFENDLHKLNIYKNELQVLTKKEHANKIVKIANEFKDNFYLSYFNDGVLNLEENIKNIETATDENIKRLKENEGQREAFEEQIKEFRIEKEVAQKEMIEEDLYTVRDNIAGMDVIGIGVDWLNGVRKGIKVYYEGDTIGEHTFYYDKDKIIKEMYKRNFYGDTKNENGDTVNCS